MIKSPARIVFMLVLAAVCLIAGCTSNKGINPSEYKEELVLAVGAEPEAGFDPTTGWGRYGSPLFQSTLLKRDHNMGIQHDLATGYEVSQEGIVWTVKLRKDAKFSDGMPVTAADVKYSFETAAQSGSTIDLSNLQSAEALDDFTIKFTLKEPQSTFSQMLVATGIVPKHAHGKDYALQPLGSGPFKLVQWDQGQQLIVEANPEYYGSKPYFNKLTFLFLNEDAAFAAAKAGKVDVSYIPAAFSKQQISGMRLESIQSVDNRGIMLPFVKSGDTTKDGKPIGNDVTADLAIRKAINVAMDRKALVQGLLEGQGTPAYTLNDGLPWFNKEAMVVDGDMIEAQKILEANGWKDTNGDGILDKGALKAEFPLIYPSSDITRQSLAIAAADMMKPLGIHMKVEGKSWEEIEKQMHASAVLFGWGSHDPLEMYNVYSSKYAGVGYYNPGFYSNSVVDDYMNKALRAADEQEAMKYWQKAQWDGQTGLSARGDAPWVWLVNLNHLYVVKENLDIGKQKIHPHGHGWPVTDNIEEWKWLK